MTSTMVDWSTALNGVVPQQGFQPLPPATYRFRILTGEGRIAGSGSIMVSCQFEVISGPKMGRKVFHNWNLPKDGSDKAKTQMGFFLGAMMVFGLTPEWFGQSFAGQQITKDHADFIAKTLVATGLTFKATASLQASDPSRNNLNNFISDDGQEPEPPKEPTATNFAPGAPQVPGGPPGLPLGGFPGSGGVGGAPITPGPEWANPQPPAPQGPPTQGQFAPAAAAPQPQQGGFPGQSFPGQVNPAQFPAPGQQAPAVAIPGQYQPPAAANAPGMQQFGTTQADQQYGGAPAAPAGPPSYDQQMQAQGNQFAPGGGQPGYGAQQAPAGPPAQGGFPGGQAAPQMPGMPAQGQPPAGAPQTYPGQPGQPNY